MTKKRRSRKGRSARAAKRTVGQSIEGRSFGSGLDEVGFRPLGRRILVSKQRPDGQPAKTALETGTEPSTSKDCLVPPTDDPLGYDASDPLWVRKAAKDVLSGEDKDAIEKEVDAALRRWRFRE
ncbi:hypothetical protein D9M68_382580 [compost metagenome]